MTEPSNDTINLDEVPMQLEGMKIHGNPAKLFGALAKARKGFDTVHRTKTVRVDSDRGSYTFDYAPLDEVQRATTPSLSENGLVVFHSIGSTETGVVITAILAHESGAFLSSFLRLPSTTRAFDRENKEWYDRAKTAQEMGSDITYRVRYMTNCLLGISAAEDDDGAAGENMHREVQERGPRAGTQSKPPALPKQAPPEKKPEPQKVVPIQKPEPPPEMRPAATSDVAPAKVSEETLNRIFAGLKELGFAKGKMTDDWFRGVLGKPTSQDISEEEGQRLLADLDKRKKAS